MGIGIGRCRVHVSFVLHESQLWLLRCCAFVLWRIANRCYKLVHNGLESSAPGSGPYIRTGSVTTAQRELRRQWGWQRVPSWRLLHQWSAAFQTQGTMVDASTHAPRPRVPAAVVRAIRRAMGRNPRLSIRRLAARVGASRTAVHRVLRLQLAFYPYKLQVVQRIKRVDKAKMLRFCFGWPTRSPDIDAPDFWIWGYLKDQVYRSPVHSLRQLNQRIREPVGSVYGSMVKQALNNLHHRLRACSHQRGGQLEQVLTRS